MNLAPSVQGQVPPTAVHIMPGGRHSCLGAGVGSPVEGRLPDDLEPGRRSEEWPGNRLLAESLGD